MEDLLLRSVRVYVCMEWGLLSIVKICTRILNKSWQQHPTRHQLYGHLPPITKSIQVRRTRHAGHCWRSRDELIRDVLLWIPTHGRAKAGRPARTYIQQLCEDTGCCPEDLPRAMNDREEWRERVRDIHAASTIWWWWWWNWFRPAIIACCCITRSHLERSLWVKDLYSCKIMAQCTQVNSARGSLKANRNSMSFNWCFGRHDQQT